MTIHRICAAISALIIGTDAIAGEASSSPAATRQSRDDAWWTGPLLAPSAATLPRGHFLIEPYLFDAIVYSRYGENGGRHGTTRVNGFGSLTYMLYGLADRITVGMIPKFGFNEVSGGPGSSRIGVGDITLQAQYRLTQFQEGGWLPTTSVVLGESLPTGKYDRLAEHPSDGFGSGAHTTTASLYSQYFFWMPNGRLLRTRLDLSYALSSHPSVEGVSVYGTGSGFQGRARPGDSFAANAAWEYSLTRNWVLALDVIYEHSGSTRVTGRNVAQAGGGIVDVEQNSGSSESLSFAPAIEYNWNGALGVIAGAKVSAAGRNTSAIVIPAIAVNFVH
jgi:hypothetical protein